MAPATNSGSCQKQPVAAAVASGDATGSGAATCHCQGERQSLQDFIAIYRVNVQPENSNRLIAVMSRRPVNSFAGIN